jgi:glycosyltransferase involved in cell wall biosynthesis
VTDTLKGEHQSPFLVIVTPVRNEAKRISKISNMLNLIKYNFTVIWIIVNDSSTDNTLEVIENLRGFKPRFVLEARTSGKLVSGGAFQAWYVGVEFAYKNYPNFSHLMKLDVDVELRETYFNKIQPHMMDPNVGLIGGVLKNSRREQNIHVPGPVKIYSQSALNCLTTLPLETGYDVMDEILLKQNGFRVVVVQGAEFFLNRSIGSSQGLIHGRRRNGLVCRWTGYYFPYFLLHLARYTFKKPFLFGGIAMLFGYLLAPASPYPKNLRALHATDQKKLLGRIARNPIRVLFALYGRS